MASITDSSSSRTTARLAALCLAIGVVVIALGSSGLAARARQTNGPLQPLRDGAHNLRVTRLPDSMVLSLDAQRAPLAAVAADLERLSGARVVVGASLSGELVSTSVSELALEAALPLLVQRPLVDYDLRQGDAPTPRVIYLLSSVDPEPPVPSSRVGNAHGFLIEGNTEERAPRRDDPLQVAYDKGLLSVVARRQPLGDVLAAVAHTLGVTFDRAMDGSALVDIDLHDMVPADLLPRISPFVRASVRVDVNQGDRMVFGVALAPLGPAVVVR